jgi:hypothetical protein
MQPGGFGGQGPGQPPFGGYPPGQPGAPQQQPGATPQHPGGPAPYQQQPHQQQPYQQQPYGAPGYPAPGAGYPGAPPAGPQGPYPGAPAGYPGAMPGGYGSPPPGMQVGMQVPGMAHHPMAAGMPMAAQSSFGQAQGALANAGGMMKLMKYAFVGIGGLCVLGGVALLIFVDAVAGIGCIFTGVVFAVVALTVLPKFAGMVGQASAMVDGFAAKEQLARTGIPAQGRLLSVQQTGRLVNYNPEIQATVEVHHPQLGVYQTQTTAIVPQIAIPRAQPGAPVQVRVSPQNQHEIALVF